MAKSWEEIAADRMTEIQRLRQIVRNLEGDLKDRGKFIESLHTNSDLSGDTDIVTLKNGYRLLIGSSAVEVYVTERDYEKGNEYTSIYFTEDI